MAAAIEAHAAARSMAVEEHAAVINGNQNSGEAIRVNERLELMLGEKQGARGWAPKGQSSSIYTL